MHGRHGPLGVGPSNQEFEWVAQTRPAAVANKQCHCCKQCLQALTNPYRAHTRPLPQSMTPYMHTTNIAICNAWQHHPLYHGPMPAARFIGDLRMAVMQVHVVSSLRTIYMCNHVCQVCGRAHMVSTQSAWLLTRLMPLRHTPANNTWQPPSARCCSLLHVATSTCGGTCVQCPSPPKPSATLGTSPNCGPAVVAGCRPALARVRGLPCGPHPGAHQTPPHVHSGLGSTWGGAPANAQAAAGHMPCDVGE